MRELWIFEEFSSSEKIENSAHSKNLCDPCAWDTQPNLHIIENPYICASFDNIFITWKNLYEIW